MWWLCTLGKIGRYKKYKVCLCGFQVIWLNNHVYVLIYVTILKIHVLHLFQINGSCYSEKAKSCKLQWKFVFNIHTGNYVNEVLFYFETFLKFWFFGHSLCCSQNTSANSSILLCEADKPLSERLKISPGEHVDYIPPQLLRKVNNLYTSYIYSIIFYIYRYLYSLVNVQFYLIQHFPLNWHEIFIYLIRASK